MAWLGLYCVLKYARLILKFDFMDKIPISLRPARQAAVDLLRDYNVVVPPVNISEILAWEWLYISEFPFPPDADDLSWLLDISDKHVFINEHDNDCNKSYTVAHELWHWVLHRNYLQKEPEKYSVVFKKKWQRMNEDILEIEADCFARNLLVPRFMLDEYRNRAWIMELSKIFWVSPFLIEQRIAQEYE